MAAASNLAAIQSWTNQKDWRLNCKAKILCIKLDPFPSQGLPQFLPFALYGLSVSMFLKAEVSTAFVNLLPENIFYFSLTVLTVPFP